MSGKLVTAKELLAGMPPSVRQRIAKEIRDMPIPDAKAIHADVLRAMEQLQNDVTKRAKKRTMESQLFS